MCEWSSSSRVLQFSRKGSHGNMYNIIYIVIKITLLYLYMYIHVCVCVCVWGNTSILYCCVREHMLIIVIGIEFFRMWATCGPLRFFLSGPVWLLREINRFSPPPHYIRVRLNTRRFFFFNLQRWHTSCSNSTVTNPADDAADCTRHFEHDRDGVYIGGVCDRGPRTARPSFFSCRFIAPSTTINDTRIIRHDDVSMCNGAYNDFYDVKLYFLAIRRIAGCPTLYVVSCSKLLFFYRLYTTNRLPFSHYARAAFYCHTQ